ncbi:MAG TPA: hypothetical protein PKG51_02720 [Arachnia sp.]|nr:hypothetical protein [Arachnia sp.]
MRVHGADVVVGPGQVALGALVGQTLGRVVAGQARAEVGAQLHERDVAAEDVHVALREREVLLEVEAPDDGEDQVDSSRCGLLEHAAAELLVEGVELGRAVSEGLDERLDGHVVVEEPERRAGADRSSDGHLANSRRPEEEEQHDLESSGPGATAH